MCQNIHDFFMKLEGFSVKEKLLFRRAFGRSLNEADAAALLKFYSILPKEIPAYDEEKWFFAACVHCLPKEYVENPLPLDQAIWEYKQISKREETFTESFEKRVIVILDMRWDDSGMLLNRMSNMIRFLESKNFFIDGRGLLNDLLRWNREDKVIQKRWVKNYVYNEEEETC